MSIFVYAAWLAGCAPADDTAHRCIATYGVDDGYDFVSDGWHSDCPELSAECAPLSVAQAEAACAADGQPCAGQIALTRGGAGCVTHEQGVPRGLDGVIHADLIYSDAHRRPVWVVSTILEQDGQASAGERLVISAEDADALERYPWP